MDEEQGLVSPIAGGIRGIRRSVSSSIFTGRAVPPPAQPDPQTTKLLSQNSLTLTTVSGQLSTISSQVGSLNNSLGAIRENLAISDQLDRQREAAKQKREAILAEQGLREGKESQLEGKIQNALLTPVRKVATFSQGILSRLGNFLLILAGGWLTDKTLSFIRLSSEGNIDELNKFKRKFLFDLALLGGIGLTLTIGISKLVATVGSLAGLALKFAFSTLLVAPFKAAINFVKRNVVDFVKNFRKYITQLLTKGPGQILKLLNPKNLLIGGGAVGMGQGLGINQKIANFFRSVTGRKIVTGASKEAVEGGAKTGLRGVLQRVPYVGSVIDVIYGIFDFKERKKNKQTDKEAAMGAGGKTVGGLIPFLVGMTLFPEPSSSIAGAIGLVILSSLGMYAGQEIGDNLSGLKEKQKKDPTYGTSEGIEGRADGGPVDAKKPYVVGEKGPELFSSDIAGMITPINFKKDSKISDAIASFEQSAQVTVIPLGDSEKGLPASASMTNSSSTPADSLPNIPSSDFANAFVGLSESMYNVMV